MRRRFFAPITIIAALIFSACRPEATYRMADGLAWHTVYHIVYRASAPLGDSVTATMRRVELSLSPFDSASVIAAINAGRTDRSDSLVSRVFLASQHVNRLSGGLFDPTVAPLVNLWGFGYQEGVDEPTQAQIDSCRALVGIADCTLTPDGRIAVKTDGTQFNFSAITKGFGCDMVGEMLSRNGCTDYMVEIGGELALRGVNPRGEPWHVQIDSPDVEGAEHRCLAVIAVTDCGVATSGNYRNYRTTASGRRVAHTISPVTGHPVVTTTLSATVIAPDCMTADALATAAMAMPPADALAMIDLLGAPYALLLVTDAAADSGDSNAADSGDSNAADSGDSNAAASAKPFTILTSSHFPPLITLSGKP